MGSIRTLLIAGSSGGPVCICCAQGSLEQQSDASKQIVVRQTMSEVDVSQFSFLFKKGTGLCGLIWLRRRFVVGTEALCRKGELVGVHKSKIFL